MKASPVSEDSRAITRARAFLSRFILRLFSAPYLPDGLIYAVLLVIALNAGLALAFQQPTYWSNFSLAKHSTPTIQGLLAAHPAIFVGGYVLFLAATWFALEIFTRWLALLIWLPLAFFQIDELLYEMVLRLDLVDRDSSFLWTVGTLAISALAVVLLTLVFLLRLERRPNAQQGHTTEPEKTLEDGRTAPAHRWFLHRPVWGAAICLAAVAVAGLWYFMTPRGGWQRITPRHSPGARCCGAIAFDPLRGRAVLFGGASGYTRSGTLNVNDTWEWDGTDWVKISTRHQPTPRMHAALAYDEARQEMVLFGGQSGDSVMSETWIYKDGDWVDMPRQETSPPPPARARFKMFYDLARQKVILSGGYGGKNGSGQAIFYQDAWEWDGQAWQEIKSPAGNPYITSFSLAWDPVGKRTIMVNYNSILAWTSDHWEGVYAVGALQPRKDASLGGLTGVGVLVFGGLTTDETAYLDDTWLLRSAAGGGTTTWERVISPMRPAPRSVGQTFSDPATGRVYMYGGSGGFNPYYDDMWVFSIPER